MTASTPRRIPLRADIEPLGAWSSQPRDMTDPGSILADGVARQRAADPAMDSAEGCAGDDQSDGDPLGGLKVAGAVAAFAVFCAAVVATYL